MGLRPAPRSVNLGQNQSRASEAPAAELELDTEKWISLLSTRSGRALLQCFRVAFKWLLQRLPSHRVGSISNNTSSLEVLEVLEVLEAVFEMVFTPSIML